MSFPEEFITTFERSSFFESPDYAETMAYFGRFEQTNRARMFTFGMSPQGRALQCLVVAEKGEFSPQDARRNGKVVVLIQNGVHAGEIEGKDACMVLVREMIVENVLSRLLHNTVLLIVPILNVDGHERRGEFNRPNQNGPKQTGWRTTSWNLNLNRDYMKADAPEMRALLRLYNVWQPDFFIDNHTTNGADYQYHITCGIERHENISGSLSAWGNDKLTPHIMSRVEEEGFITGPYVEMRGASLSDGLEIMPQLPRYSGGYAAAQNRLLLLVEAHSLKPFENRVRSTKAINVAALEYINAHYSELKNVNYFADASTVHEYRHERRLFPLTFKRVDEPAEVHFKGFESHEEESEITHAPVVRYSTTPVDVVAPLFDAVEVETTADVPFAYAIPQEFSALVEILKLHGIETKSLLEGERLTVERYRFVDVTFAPRPYEGRQRVTTKVRMFTEEVFLPEGTVIVYTAQRTLRVMMHLLEPESPDSFVSWGFFNAYFERKEYAEPYVLEPIAHTMMADDPKLRDEFSAMLENVTGFRDNPKARLDFFYERSPYFDRAERVYPIMRVPYPEEVRP